MTDTTNAADELRAAADRAREIGDPLHLALAQLLDLEADVIGARAAADGTTEWAVDIGGDHVLAVARQVLGTTTGQQCPECSNTGACNGGPCPLGTTGQPETEAPALLTAFEGQFLAFALDQAAEELSLGAGFTVESAAALDRLRRLAAEAQQPTPDEAEERPVCGDSEHRHIGPCTLYATPAPAEEPKRCARCREPIDLRGTEDAPLWVHRFGNQYCYPGLRASARPDRTPAP